MCGESVHQACSSPPIIASQRPACHRHPNTLTPNLQLQIKISWDLKKVFLDKHVFHQDDQLGQAFATCIPELANVLVLELHT